MTGPGARSRRLAPGRLERLASAPLVLLLSLRMLPHGMLLTPPVKRRAPQAMLSQLRIWQIMR
jgi:hypothetical protein